jgi:hypothetical protein
MPTKKIVGSGLTRREETFYSLDEIESMPPLPTLDDDHKKTFAHALECLRRHGLPDRQARYLIGPGRQWRRITNAEIMQLPSRKENYLIHFGFWDGGADEDTPPWLAV